MAFHCREQSDPQCPEFDEHNGHTFVNYLFDIKTHVIGILGGAQVFFVIYITLTVATSIVVEKTWENKIKKKCLLKIKKNPKSIKITLTNEKGTIIVFYSTTYEENDCFPFLKQNIPV